MISCARVKARFWIPYTLVAILSANAAPESLPTLVFREDWKWAKDPDLSRVDEIGFTDLMHGGGSPACSRLDWIEVWGKAVPR